MEYDDETHEALETIGKAVCENSKPNGNESKVKYNYKIKEVLEDFWKFWQDVFKHKQTGYQNDGIIDKENPLPYREGTIKNIKVEFNEEWEDKIFNALFDTIKCHKVLGTNSLTGEVFIFSPEKLKLIWKRIYKIT